MHGVNPGHREELLNASKRPLNMPARKLREQSLESQTMHARSLSEQKMPAIGWLFIRRLLLEIVRVAQELPT